MSLIADCHHCFFDLDGTLVDSNEAHVETWDLAFRHFGKKFSRDQLRAQIGKGSDQYLPMFLTPAELKKFGNELDKYRSKLFKKDYLARIKPFPKVRRLFEHLKEMGKRLMLVTSGKEAETNHYLKLLRIEKLIVGYTSADDANQSKPAPDLFQVALKKSGASPMESVAIGDTCFDMEAAGKANIEAAGFLCGGKPSEELRAAGASEIYRDPCDLLVQLQRR
jgi:haloacid dehalogenase superfamily, subfamily IA, variant 3 with third motif having DD or ED/haloacid dehalogenase superfamily, subfamily IA, variant 1 with third motif having Dx(3-4)D or Dx(3-4)E